MEDPYADMVPTPRKLFRDVLGGLVGIIHQSQCGLGLVRGARKPKGKKKGGTA